MLAKKMQAFYSFEKKKITTIFEYMKKKNRLVFLNILLNFGCDIYII